jgi:hypothetical protein
MYEQIIVGAGLALLLVFCLPFAGMNRLILEISTLVLRLAVLALLAAAAYLYFVPEQPIPTPVTDVLADIPAARDFLPEPGSPYFGLSIAVPTILALLPLLAVLDVTRNLAGWRMRRLRFLAARPVVETPVVETPVVSGPVVQAPVVPAAVPQRGTAPILRRIDRRVAAETLTTATPRPPAP